MINPILSWFPSSLKDKKASAVHSNPATLDAAHRREEAVSSSGWEVLQALDERSRQVDVWGQRLQDEEIAQLIDEVKRRDDVDSLELGRNTIGPASLNALQRLFASSQSLSRLHLSGCLLGDSGVYQVSLSLEGSLSLEELFLDCNRATDESTYALERIMLTCPKLKSINMANNLLSSLGMCVTDDNTSITALNLRRNSICDKGAQAIGQFLKTKSCKLDSLDMAENEVCDKGALFLGKGLSVNKSLKELFLHGNHLEMEGIRVMGVYVSSNDTLLRITLTSAEDEVDVQVLSSL
eukprot:751163-Hanusia_phi.AAC.2